MWGGRVFQRRSLIKLVYRGEPVRCGSSLDAASLPPLPNLERKSFADKTSGEGGRKKRGERETVYRGGETLCTCTSVWKKIPCRAYAAA